MYTYVIACTETDSISVLLDRGKSFTSSGSIFFFPLRVVPSLFKGIYTQSCQIKLQIGWNCHFWVEKNTFGFPSWIYFFQADGRPVYATTGARFILNFICGEAIKRNPDIRLRFYCHSTESRCPAVSDATCAKNIVAWCYLCQSMVLCVPGEKKW